MRVHIGDVDLKDHPCLSIANKRLPKRRLTVRLLPGSPLNQDYNLLFCGSEKLPRFRETRLSGCMGPQALMRPAKQDRIFGSKPPFPPPHSFIEHSLSRENANESFNSWSKVVQRCQGKHQTFDVNPLMNEELDRCFGCVRLSSV
jgi:hypothetical protein